MSVLPAPNPPRPPRGSSLRLTRVVALGALLGLACAVVVLSAHSLLRRPVPRLDPALEEPLRGTARAVLPALRTGPEWRIVARVQTPWGESVRLRPFCAGVEVRGADCVLQGRDAVGGPSPEAVGTTVERDPALVAWERITTDAVRWHAEAVTAVDSAIGEPGIAAPAVPHGPDPRRFIELRDDGLWHLGVELALSNPLAGTRASSAALAAWSWADGAAPGSETIEAALLFEPGTLRPTVARDLRHYASGIEAAGRALVFDPNPVAASGLGDLREGDPVDEWRVWVDLPRLDGSGALRGRLVEALSDRPPLAREAGLVFAYPSWDPRFEEAMAYYHGDAALAEAEALGFSGLFDAPLRLRVHGTMQDNSWYSRLQREIVLGDGGVDDAEDADIILHEIGHALHDALVPGFGAGDTRAISEGFGDYWAASLTGEACIGDWDATSYSPPCLRRADDPVVWPTSLTGRPHADGRIWSALFWDIEARLGPQNARRLALAAFLEQGTATSWSEAAQGVLRAASRLGLPSEAVEEPLAIRGLIPRRIEIELASEESHAFPLASPAPFLDGTAAAIVVAGDGRLFFPDAAALRLLAIGKTEPLALPAFPFGPPSAAPVAFDDASGLRLRVRGAIDGEHARFELEWLAAVGPGARTTLPAVARAEMEWNLLDGGVRWTYLDLDGARASAAYAGATATATPSDSVRTVDLRGLTEEGQGGLRAFRSSLRGDDLVGAEYRIDRDGPGAMRIATARAALTGGGSPAVAASPNPFRGSTEILLRTPSDTRGQVTVHDALGRRVATVHDGPIRRGATQLSWDGCNAAGRDAPSGAYWIRIETASGAIATTRVVRLR